MKITKRIRSGSRFSKSLVALCALFGLMAMHTANAGLVEFTATGVLDSSGTIDIEGTSAGGAFTIKVFADNGNSSLISQSWSLSDILSGSFDSGTYHADYLSPQFSSSSFATNGLGQLTTAFYADCCFGGNDFGTDNFGTGTNVVLFSNAVEDFHGHFSFLNNSVVNTNVGAWSASIVGVPEPGTLILLSLGLMGVGYSSRAKKLQ